MTLTLDPATTELPVLDEPVDDGTRREFLAGAGVIAVLGLAACGGGDETPAADATRLVRHSAGTTDVPARPTRIVALGGNAITAGAIVLGLTPVGAPEIVEDELAPFAELVPADVDLQEIASAGELPYEPNLEAIATIAPEMIVGDDGGFEEEYDALHASR